MSKPHPLAACSATRGRTAARIARGGGCSILNKVFDLAPPVLIGAAVDVVVGARGLVGRGASASAEPETSSSLAGATLVIWVLESVFEYA